MTLSISQMAAAAGVTSHTLRYYERAGLLPSVDRTRIGHRRYSALDVAWVQMVTNLRATGMPIRDVRRFVELVAADAPDDTRLALLEEHRASTLAKLEEAARHLAAVQAKIDHHRGDRSRCEPR